MDTEASHDVCCTCGETLTLSEKTLRRVLANLQEVDRTAPRITFVCQHCGDAVRFDCHRRMDLSEDVPESPAPSICIVGTKCGKSDCGSTLELVVFAKAGTTTAEFERDLHSRDWTRFYCENRHSLVSVGSVRQIC